MSKEFLQTNVAVGKSAMENGLEFFSFYPITPSTETGEYLSAVMDPKKFLNAYSEIEVINSMYGASACGKRTMTATSGLGLSLMREGLSYMIGSRLPGVIYCASRFGPGLGGITSSTQDISIVWGAGSGESKIPVLTPSTTQETVDCIVWAFEIADTLRTPVIVMVDAILAQMYESVEINKGSKAIEKDWCVGQGKGNVITSRKILSYKAGLDEQAEQIKSILKKEDSMYGICKLLLHERTVNMKYNPYGEYITAIGTTGRVVQEVAEKLNIGYIVPIMLSPFETIPNVHKLTVVEIGGRQLADIMKYNYPLAKVKSITFPHSVPDAEEICQQMK